MSKKDKLNVPEAKTVDTIHTLTKAGLSSIPIIGGAASELFSLVIMPSLEKRRIEWMNAIAIELREQESKIEGFSIEGLKENETFITIVMHATTLALRNHQEEKLLALKNSVINTALEIDIEENLQLTFLNNIDSLTLLHMRILMYFHDPEKWFRENKITFNLSRGTQAHALEIALPDLQGQRNIYDQMYEDLYNRGLVSVDKNMIHAGTSSMLLSRTTDIGRKFIQYMTQ